MDDDGNIITLRGTSTLLYLPPAAWDRRRTAYPVPCPDGVTRCITFANWRWRPWAADFDRDAFASGAFAPLVAEAWRFAQALSATYDSSSVMAEKLLRLIEECHRRPYFKPANNNPSPDFWEAWIPIPRPPGWRRGGLSGFFWSVARVPPPTPRADVGRVRR